MSSGNFEFLARRDQELMKTLSEAESWIRIDLVKAGTTLRQGMEQFAYGRGADLIAKKDSNKEKEQLKDRFALLRSSNHIRFPDGVNNSFECRTINSDGKISKPIKGDSIDYSLGICNLCVHYETKPRRLIKELVNFDSVVKAFDCFRNVIYWCYRRDEEPIMPPEYDISKIRISKYIIEEAYTPTDADITQCRQEYLAHYRNDRGKVDGYAILREYSNSFDNTISEKDSMKLKRASDAADAFKELKVAESLSLANVNWPSSFNKKDLHVPFCVLAYEFEKKPLPLSGVLEK